MRASLTCLRRRLQSESGWSLVELLAAMGIFTFVLVAMLGLLDVSTKTTPKDAERANAIQEAQVGLDRMVRELRHAHKLEVTDSREIQFKVIRGRDDPATTANEAVERFVAYSCYAGRCDRREVAATGEALASDTPETVIARVLNTANNLPADRAVFDDSGNANTFSPTYVRVHLEVPAAGERPDGYSRAVVLEDGFHARNIKAGG